MHIENQRKIVCIMGASFLAFILASTAIAMKYDEYVEYVVWGGYLYAALLVIAVLRVKKRGERG